MKLYNINLYNFLKYQLEIIIQIILKYDFNKFNYTVN